jgi:predicted amidohydrolase
VVNGIETLAEQDVDVVVLPEMWSCGFDNERLMDHAAVTPDILARVGRLAREHRMAVCGSLPGITGDGTVANTQYLIDRDGNLRVGYSKVHLFSPNGEDRYFSPGNEAVVTDASFGNVGFLTCYDIRFPELGRDLALKGAEIIIVSAQWPMSRSHHWDVLLKARAVENQVFVFAANSCGVDSEREYAGKSMVVSPWGDVLGKAEKDDYILVADIDMDDLKRAREAIPCFRDRRPDVYGK